jgi:hypothetical protein
MVYLVLTIERERDRLNHRDFFRISAEPYNIYASGIYRLVRFRNKGLFTNTSQPSEPASFWMNRTDTTTIYYNYFQNTTEALMYLADQGWELITINNAIISTYGTTVQSEPYTKIRSTAVFYFKREIISPGY